MCKHSIAACMTHYMSIYLVSYRCCLFLPLAHCLVLWLLYSKVSMHHIYCVFVILLLTIEPVQQGPAHTLVRSYPRNGQALNAEPRWKWGRDITTVTDINASNLVLWLATVNFENTKGNEDDPWSWTMAVKEVQTLMEMLGTYHLDHNGSLNDIISIWSRSKFSSIAKVFYVMLAHIQLAFKCQRWAVHFSNMLFLTLTTFLVCWKIVLSSMIHHPLASCERSILQSLGNIQTRRPLLSGST